MAIIQSGVDSSQWTIDPTSKAGRVSLYGPDGEPLLYTSNRDRGIASINVRQSATTAAAAAVWAIRNATSGKVLYISKIWIQFFFDGTGAASLMKYEFIKGTGCTSMSGGAAVTPLAKRTGMTNPDVDARVLDTGLTMTGISYGASFWNASWPRLTFSATQAGGVSEIAQLDFGDKPIELVQNDALVLRQLNTSVVGDSVGGGVEFFGG